MRIERMPDPMTLVPGAAEALAALRRAVTGVDRNLLALCELRAAQINGCAAGVARAAAGLSAAQRLGVAVWRDTPWFTAEERAALALTEAVTTLGDGHDPVPDRVWDVAATHFDRTELAALLLGIAIANAVDRIDTSTRRQATSIEGENHG